MKQLNYLLLVFVLLISCSCKSKDFQHGDIIFQTSLSNQSKAIQIATNSKYSHCGIILDQGDKKFVFEAFDFVKLTSLDEWIARGENRHYVVKRLKNADEVLTEGALRKMQEEAFKFLGKGYDSHFEWSDNKMYCSELIWKIYQRATGLEVGELEKLRDFDLSNEEVKQKLKERYGNHIPINETVISPSAIYNSKLLKTVYKK